MPFDYTVPALHRAIQALELLTCTEDGLSLADLSKRLNVPKSTLFRIMVTLEKNSIVSHDKNRKIYSLGMKLVEWGHAALERVDLKQIGHPHLEKLAEETNESFYLAVLDNYDVIVIDRADTPDIWRIVTRLGARSPVHATATGQVLVADKDDDVIEKVIERTGLRRFTDQTITNPAKFRKRLQEVSKQGYSITDAEYKPDLCAVAVPIRDYGGHVIASLMTALRSDQARKQKSHLRALIAVLQREAAAISRQIGHQETVRQKESAA